MTTTCRPRYRSYRLVVIVVVSRTELQRRTYRNASGASDGDEDPRNRSKGPPNVSEQARKNWKQGGLTCDKSGQA